MPENYNNKTIYLNTDAGNEHLQNTSGWYLRNNNNIRKKKTETNIDVERNKTLRIKDSTIKLPGVMRFNSTLQQFQGYTGNLRDSSEGWTSFQTFTGIDGTNGLNSIAEMTGLNVSNDANTFGIFKDIVSETLATSTTADIVLNNQVENIYTSPSYTFSSFNYVSTTQNMDLSNKTLTFVPYLQTSFKVFVRENDIYPPVSYYSHSTVRTLNENKIDTNNHYKYYLQGKKFRFYNTIYTYVYIHQNGYLNFVGGDSSLLTGNYPNHFSNYRISAFLNNLINNSTGGEKNQADIYVGTGPYGETVITYNNFSVIEIDPNNTSNSISDNYNNFQIRIWTEEVGSNNITNYSDDNYPAGTIQISYGKSEQQTPLVGISNQQTYNETTFVPLPFSNLLDNDYTEVTGLGVPQLDATFVFEIPNSTQASILASNKNFQDLEQLEISGNKYKLIIKNKNWTSSYSEKYNGSYYYTRIMDLGPVNGIQQFYCAIQGLHDINLSDISNKDENDNSINLNNWDTNDEKFTNISYLYSTTRIKDYIEVYKANSFNTGIYNSYLCSIQMRYTDSNIISTSGTGTTRLYTGATEKRLLVKIIYKLGSDIDTPIGNTSFNNATNITLSTPTTNFQNFIANGNEEFHFIPGSSDHFKFSVDVSKSYQIELFDNSPDNASRNNYGLSMELYKQTSEEILPILYKSSTNVNLNISNNLNTYPGTTIDQELEYSNNQSTKTFYVVVSGSLKSYYYGIKIKISTSVSLNTNILTLTVPNVNYNSLSSGEREDLKDKIKTVVAGSSDSDTIELSTITSVILQRTTTSNGTNNITATVVFSSSTIGELGDIVTKFNTTPPSVTFNVNGVSTLKLLSNPSANTTTIANLPTDTIPMDNDDSAPPEPPSNQDYTANNILTLKKAKYLSGQANLNENYSGKNYFDLYFHTSINLDDKIYYCYFVIDLSTSGSSLELVLHVFNKSESNVFSSLLVDDINFSSLDELIKFPFNIFNQGNKIVVLYGKGTNDSKSFNLKKFEVTNIDNKITIQISSNESYSSSVNQNTIFKQNNGVIDSVGNIYCLEIINNKIHIVKFDKALNKTTLFSITEFDFSSNNYLKLYNSRDRFNELTYLYLFNKVSSNDYKINRINIQLSNPEVPRPRYFVVNNTLAFIRQDGTVYYNNSDSYAQNNFNTINNENKLNEIVDLVYAKGDVIVRSKGGNIFSWKYQDYSNEVNYILPDLTNVVSIVPNEDAIAFLYQTDNIKKIQTEGLQQYGGDMSKYNNTDGTSTPVVIADDVNIAIIKATYGAFAALTTNGKIISWGQYSYSINSTIQNYDYGGNHPSSFDALVFNELFSNNNSFAALTNDKKLYTWGNIHSSNKTNRNPEDTINNNIYPEYISSVYHVRRTQYAWAVLVPDKDPSTEGWDENPSFQVICFGGEGKNIDNNYGYYTSNNAGNYNNYGEYMNYYDYTSSTIISLDSLGLNSNIKKLYSNDYAFAALTHDNKVITWGYSEDGINYGGSPYYQDNSFNWISVENKLSSGVNDIVSNAYSFLAIKDNEIVVWGNRYSGGAPYIIDDSVQHPEAEMNYSSLTVNNVIPNNNGYAIFQNSEVNFIGGGMKLNGGDYMTNTINNVIDVQSAYVSSPDNNLGFTNIMNPFVITKSDVNENISIINFQQYNIPSNNDIKSNFSPVKKDNTSIITEDLVNYDYILGNINQRNNVVFTTFKEDYFYLRHNNSNYGLYRNRLENSIIQLSDLDNKDEIVFLQFEIVEGNHNYLLIVYNDSSNSTNKLVVIKLGDLIDDIKILSHSISTIQGVKIIQDKLYNYYYSSTVPKKFVVDVYDLGESNISASNPPSYEIYNVDNESTENEIVMPEDYVITEAFGNALTVDNNLTDPSFFMIAKNDTKINTNKFNYFLFQFDNKFNTRSIDFSNYTEIKPSLVLSIEDTKLGEPDILKMEENVIDNLNLESNYHVSYILENTVLAIYNSGQTLYLKIYDEYEFIEYNIELNNDKVKNLNVLSSYTIHTLYWETDTEIYIYQIEYLGSGDIKSLIEKSFLKVEGKQMTNIINIEEIVLFGYYSQAKDKYIIVKLEDGNEENILELASNINLKYLRASKNIIYIFTNTNTYYEFNLDTCELENGYLLYSISQPNMLFLNLDRFYVGIIEEKLHFIKNNESILNLGIDNIKIVELKKLESVNNIILIFENGIKENKSIIIYNIETGEIKNNTYIFDFYVSQDDLLLLFHAREYNNKITVRYLNKNLELLYLNQFENIDFNFKNLGFLHNLDNSIEFWGIKEDEDDIEESNVIFKLNYKNISQGKYPTYSYILNSSNTELVDNENILLEISYPLSVENSILSNSRTTANENNLVLELVAEVSVVQQDNAYKYLFEHKQLSGSGVGTYDSNNDYRLKLGTYILKNVPYNYPLAILVNTSTGNKNMITYRGLSYNNLNPNNVGSSLVKQVIEDSDTHFYYFYYGDIEIKVLGDFGSVSFYSYNNGYMGGEKNFVFDNSIVRNTDIESNNLYERDGNNRILKFPYYGGDPKNSNFVIGRSTNSSYSDNDIGANLFSYVKSYYKSSEESCFYIRSNGIPNYQPSIFGKEYKGNWTNEASSLNLDNKNYYSIYYQNRGWFDNSNLLQGTVIKMPLEPRLASQNIYTSKVTFQENFWFTEDIYWKTIMDDTKYSSKLLTPMGPIAIALNGVSFYNFAVMQNTVNDTYSSSSIASGNFDYETSSNLVTTLSTNKSEIVINGVENSINNTQIYDNQGGSIDLNHHYHYRYYPITLEGQIFFGTIKNRDPDNKVLFSNENLVPTENFKLYIGHTYYINVNEASNRNTNNENLQVGFVLYLESESESESENNIKEYNFENTLVRSGDSGLGIGSYVKFKIPNTLTTNDSLQLVRVKNQTAHLNTTNLVVPSYGGFYNKITETNTNPHIKLGFKPKTITLNIINLKFSFKNSNGDKFDSSNFYFEKDVIYTIILGNDYKVGNYKLGFKIFIDNRIKIYNPVVFEETDTQISVRFNEELNSLSIYNIMSDFDNSGTNYPNIKVYNPESLHYYTRVDTEQFKFYNYNLLGDFTFNGQLEWEDAYTYLINKKLLPGPLGHSPLLGYAFDGFPIYGPLGYDKSKSQYYSNNDSTIPVKFMRSSYTYNDKDSNGNPMYDPSIGDLDFSNGIFSKTPEFPQGVYHYICTIKLDSSGNPSLEEDSSYGFRNVPKKIIKPAYPYVIGAFKGVPELSNFPWATANGATSNTNIEKKKFTFNFKSLKSESVSVNGKTSNSVSITQDENNLKLLVNPQSFKWNFSNSIQTSIFGRDDTIFGNKISNLISSNTDTTLKCYGKVSKWTSSGNIDKGTFLTITNKTVGSDVLLCAKTYSETGLSEQDEHVAVLGVALNDVSVDGDEVYVCEEGITSVVVNNNSTLKCSSYGIISVLSENTGRVVALNSNTNILSNTPVVGIFLENKDVVSGDFTLFKVKTNYEFN